MAHIEVLFGRRVLFWFTLGAVAIDALLALPVLTGNHASAVADDRGSGGILDLPSYYTAGIPLGVLFFLGGYVASFVATIVAASLNRANRSRDVLWTLPVSRERVAVSYFVVDIAIIVIAYIEGVIAFGLFPLWIAGRLHLVLPPETWLDFAASLGAPVMWYALLQFATAGYSGKGGILSGLSWPLAFILVLAATVHMSPVAHALVAAVNSLNPLEYLPMSFQHGYDTGPVTLLPRSVVSRALISWSIASVAATGAILVWRRAEA